jgi:predicted transposase YbfD/YdcC
MGQVRVAQKANEILATPKLLHMLDVQGAVVFIDANLIRREPDQDSMRGQRKVAAWDDAFLESIITG